MAGSAAHDAAQRCHWCALASTLFRWQLWPIQATWQAWNRAVVLVLLKLSIQKLEGCILAGDLIVLSRLDTSAATDCAHAKRARLATCGQMMPNSDTCIGCAAHWPVPARPSTERTAALVNCAVCSAFLTSRCLESAPSCRFSAVLADMTCQCSGS